MILALFSQEVAQVGGVVRGSRYAGACVSRNQTDLGWDAHSLQAV